MKLVRLYAVIAVEDDFDPIEDADTLLSEQLPNDRVMFWTAQLGYTGEMDDLGADPSSWQTEAEFDPCPTCCIIPGVLVGTNGHDKYVQSCDECGRYGGDLPAAAALAAKLGGVVKFYVTAEVDDADGYAVGEGYGEVISGDIRTYADTLPDDVFVAAGTDPWIEVDGKVVHWIMGKPVLEIEKR